MLQLQAVVLYNMWCTTMQGGPLYSSCKQWFCILCGAQLCTVVHYVAAASSGSVHYVVHNYVGWSTIQQLQTVVLYIMWCTTMQGGPLYSSCKQWFCTICGAQLCTVVHYVAAASSGSVHYVVHNYVGRSTMQQLQAVVLYIMWCTTMQGVHYIAAASSSSVHYVVHNYVGWFTIQQLQVVVLYIMWCTTMQGGPLYSSCKQWFCTLCGAQLCRVVHYIAAANSGFVHYVVHNYVGWSTIQQLQAVVLYIMWCTIMNGGPLCSSCKQWFCTLCGAQLCRGSTIQQLQAVVLYIMWCTTMQGGPLYSSCKQWFCTLCGAQLCRVVHYIAAASSGSVHYVVHNYVGWSTIQQLQAVVLYIMWCTTMQGGSLYSSCKQWFCTLCGAQLCRGVHYVAAASGGSIHYVVHNYVGRSTIQQLQAVVLFIMWCTTMQGGPLCSSCKQWFCTLCGAQLCREVHYVAAASSGSVHYVVHNYAGWSTIQQLQAVVLYIMWCTTMQGGPLYSSCKQWFCTLCGAQLCRVVHYIAAASSGSVHYVVHNYAGWSTIQQLQAVVLYIMWCTTMQGGPLYSSCKQWFCTLCVAQLCRVVHYIAAASSGSVHYVLHNYAGWTTIQQLQAVVPYIMCCTTMQGGPLHSSCKQWFCTFCGAQLCKVDHYIAAASSGSVHYVVHNFVGCSTTQQLQEVVLYIMWCTTMQGVPLYSSCKQWFCTLCGAQLCREVHYIAAASSGSVHYVVHNYVGNSTIQQLQAVVLYIMWCTTMQGGSLYSNCKQWFCTLCGAQLCREVHYIAAASSGSVHYVVHNYVGRSTIQQLQTVVLYIMWCTTMQGGPLYQQLQAVVLNIMWCTTMQEGSLYSSCKQWFCTLCGAQLCRVVHYIAAASSGSVHYVVHNYVGWSTIQQLQAVVLYIMWCTTMQGGPLYSSCKQWFCTLCGAQLCRVVHNIAAAAVVLCGANYVGWSTIQQLQTVVLYIMWCTTMQGGPLYSSCKQWFCTLCGAQLCRVVHYIAAANSGSVHYVVHNYVGWSTIQQLQAVVLYIMWCTTMQGGPLYSSYKQWFCTLCGAQLCREVHYIATASSGSVHYVVHNYVGWSTIQQLQAVVLYIMWCTTMQGGPLYSSYKQWFCTLCGAQLCREVHYIAAASSGSVHYVVHNYVGRSTIEQLQAVVLYIMWSTTMQGGPLHSSCKQWFCTLCGAQVCREIHYIAAASSGSVHYVVHNYIGRSTIQQLQAVVLYIMWCTTMQGGPLYSSCKQWFCTLCGAQLCRVVHYIEAASSGSVHYVLHNYVGWSTIQQLQAVVLYIMWCTTMQGGSLYSSCKQWFCTLCGSQLCRVVHYIAAASSGSVHYVVHNYVGSSTILQLQAVVLYIMWFTTMQGGPLYSSCKQWFCTLCGAQLCRVVHYIAAASSGSVHYVVHNYVGWSTIQQLQAVVLYIMWCTTMQGGPLYSSCKQWFCTLCGAQLCRVVHYIAATSSGSVHYVVHNYVGRSTIQQLQAVVLYIMWCTTMQGGPLQSSCKQWFCTLCGPQLCRVVHYIAAASSGSVHYVVHNYVGRSTIQQLQAVVLYIMWCTTMQGGPLYSSCKQWFCTLCGTQLCRVVHYIAAASSGSVHYVVHNYVGWSTIQQLQAVVLYIMWCTTMQGGPLYSSCKQWFCTLCGAQLCREVHYIAAASSGSVHYVVHNYAGWSTIQQLQAVVPYILWCTTMQGGPLYSSCKQQFRTFCGAQLCRWSTIQQLQAVVLYIMWCTTMQGGPLYSSCKQWFCILCGAQLCKVVHYIAAASSGSVHYVVHNYAGWYTIQQLQAVVLYIMWYTTMQGGPLYSSCKQWFYVVHNSVWRSTSCKQWFCTL